jgi:hypothetical protein
VKLGSFIERATGKALSGLVGDLSASLLGVRALPSGAWAIWQGGGAE